MDWRVLLWCKSFKQWLKVQSSKDGGRSLFAFIALGGEAEDGLSSAQGDAVGEIERGGVVALGAGAGNAERALKMEGKQG
jgi:hypothetical protein